MRIKIIFHYPNKRSIKGYSVGFNEIFKKFSSNFSYPLCNGDMPNFKNYYQSALNQDSKETIIVKYN